MADRTRLLTKTQLKEQRLKPAHGQRPDSRYWQGQGWVDLYAAAMAVPMRPYREPSSAQRLALAAGRDLVGTAPCTGCGQRADRSEFDGGGRCDTCAALAERERIEDNWRTACARAAAIVAQRAHTVDTETSGLDADAEIIEISVVDVDGVVLLDTLVKPAWPVPSEATAIHGITDAMLASAPTWAEVGPVVAQLLQGRAVVAHNAGFDARMLAQANARCQVAPADGVRWECTLALLTDVNDGRWPSLAVAMDLAGAVPPDGSAGQPHRAAYDALCCRAIVHNLAAAAAGANREGEKS